MAICGMCKRIGRLQGFCWEDHDLHYPLMTAEHECPDYEYQPDDKPCLTPFNVAQFLECADCAHCVDNRCDGKEWIPFTSHPKCQFWRDRRLTCKHAIPELQYGNGIRNNRCSLPPEQRQTEARQGKDWRCPNAHRFTSMKCYEPREAS